MVSSYQAIVALVLATLHDSNKMDANILFLSMNFTATRELVMSVSLSSNDKFS